VSVGPSVEELPPGMPKVVAGYKTQARARILDGARAVFQRKGLSQTTMEDIAKEIGVSKGALYVYFRTKTQLLAAIQSEARDEVLRKWKGLLEKGDVVEGIARSIDSVFTGDTDPSVWYRLVADAAGDPEVRTALELDQREDVKVMRRFLRQLEDRGRIPKIADPETVANIVMMLLQGTAFLVLLRGETRDARRKLVRALRLVLGV
jgi:AcrR family transcriptional regulator